ncbi:hypothetical protein MIND_00916000 [Mycena indigotica]|uniref:Uncharacterized protein n=1 Tax=Mycena indigotica TaxID=2126181 RepID=A0A8H6SEG6_9AGAR|nr:uncharacterized protein MIND_00916000 [Mycena indigotica]KAF7296847.1 hypothetical protein MIND_00916000 [Mycena indigotica]
MKTMDDVSHSPDADDWKLSGRADSYDTSSGSSDAQSSSTVPGPGELSGKAIMALGRATIRGIDHFVIMRQLAVIAGQFPLRGAAGEREEEVREMFVDLLEFSRPGLYREEVNKKALRLLLAQIATGETALLIRVLSQWDKLELKLFLAEVLVQLAPLWNPRLGSFLSAPLLTAYTNAGPPTPMTPLLHFLSRLVRTRASICQVTLDVGVLEVIASLRDFSQCVPFTNVLLLDIAAYPEHRQVLSAHPLLKLWPLHPITQDTVCPPFATRERVMFLNSERDILEADLVLYGTINLLSLIALPCISGLDSPQLFAGLAFGVEYDQALRVYLLTSPYKAKVALLSRIFRYVREYSARKEDGLRSRYSVLFALKLVSAAAWGPSNRAALLDAGVIGFLVRIVETEVPQSYAGIAASQIPDLLAISPPTGKATRSRGRTRAKTESQAEAPEIVPYDLSSVPAGICDAGLARLLGGPLARTSRLVGLIAAAFAALFPPESGH